MILYTEDREFGVHVVPVGPYLLFRFQLLLGGAVIGDAEPTPIYSAILELTNVPEISSLDLPDIWTKKALKTFLKAPENRALIGQMSEAQDGWRNVAFRCDGNVHIIAQDHENKDRVFGVSVEEEEYFGVAHALMAYWERRNPRRF